MIHNENNMLTDDELIVVSDQLKMHMQNMYTK